MANKRLKKALEKLTDNEKKLLTEHLLFEEVERVFRELKKEGYEFNHNYQPFGFCRSHEDFIRIALIKEVKRS